MASEASWQTGDSGGLSDTLPADEPMDQRTVESLLRRLVHRVEESERRYGEALDELHTRLDRLSQTTEAVRETSPPQDDDTFDRLQAEVSNLTRRLEDEAASPLDDFERLGRALTGGLRGDTPELDSAFDQEPEPSPFAQAAMAGKTGSRPGADLYDPEVPAFAYGDVDLDKRLVEMAERLERSIGDALPARAIESLNARLDEIGNQLSQTLDTAPSREALEHVEQQISDMGQQLTRAEEQLGKFGGVEEHLLKLIERLDQKDQETPASIDPVQLQEVAAKAATEAARIIADDSKKTSERLDALHRDLSAMTDKSRESGDRLVSTLEAVHESLKQLVQQVERGNAFVPGPRVPFAERTRPAEARPTAPFVPPPAPHSPTPQAAAPRPQAPQAQKASPEPRIPEMRPPTGRSAAAADVAVKDQKLRDRLGAAMPDFKEIQETAPPFGRAKQPLPDQDPVDLDDKPEQDTPSGSPDNLVAAARRAARAAAAQAEERGGRRSKMHLAGSGSGAEPGRRKRSWLMISAATLLAVSAILLYGRLSSKPEPEVAPAATEETTPAPAPAETGTDAKPAETAPAPAPDRSGIWPPQPSNVPFDVGQAPTGLTEMAKSADASSESTPPMPASELAPQAQPASLTPTNAVMMPPGVFFSVEEPVASAGAQPAAQPNKAPLPPAALGPLSLRTAAAQGDVAAQYQIADRYADGKGTARDLKKTAEWLERAAQGGLAPAQYRLAAMYERGQGVDRSLDTARTWYKSAAENGNVKAMHNLAVSVSGRDGSAPDYPLAAKWYGKAAAHGLADSQFNLGILAEHGLGVPKALGEAYKWYSLAAAQGDAEATKRRDVVAAQLTPEDRAKLDAEVKTWTANPALPAANTVAEFVAPAAEATAAAAPATEAGSLVSRAQTLLNKLGYDVGPPDGVVGSRTRTEIKRFQERNGLEQTGEVTVPLVTQLEHLTS